MCKLCLLLLFCIGILQGSSQPGSLDPTFGNNGIQTTAFFTNRNLSDEKATVVLASANGAIFVVAQASSFTRIVKFLPNGKLNSSYGNAGYSNAVSMNGTCGVMQRDKIVVAGSAYNTDNNNQDFALARYMANGRLDPSFGVNGIVTTDFNNSNDDATSIALQADKILVVGSSSGGFALARYSADGVLDSSFGRNGKITTQFVGADGASSIALQGNKILVAGSTYSTDRRLDFALVRYTADGALDSSFGENGRVTTDLGTNDDDRAYSIAMQGNRIIVGGYSGYIYTRSNFALVSYTAAGALDSSFGEHGTVTTDFKAEEDHAYSIALQGDKIILAGRTIDPNNNRDFALARYTADGIPDSSFGVNGKVTTDFNKKSADVATSIAIQADKILVVGSSSGDFALARYNADGVLDPSLGVNGKVTGYFPASETYFTSTAIQGNKIIAAGYAVNDNYDYNFALARYTADGTLDSSFGKKGKVTTDFNSDFNEANSIVLQGDKILVAYTEIEDWKYDFGLARYTVNGRLDSPFGVNGKVITDFNSDFNWAKSIVLQGDKILVGGTSGDLDFALARYTSNGTLDSSFGKNGLVTTNFFNNSDDEATSIALQGDKIIVIGRTSYYDDSGDYFYDFALARYTNDGSLDSSFGVNGKVIIDFNSDDNWAKSVVLQGDKILVAGYTFNYPTDDFAIARYTVNGTLDSSFGKNGTVTTDFNNTSDFARSIVLQGDKIIMGGSSDYDFALARYTSNGTLDSSFGKNGKVITHLETSSSIQAIIVHENRLYAVGSVTAGPDKTFGVIAAYQLESPGPTISIADVTVSESKLFAVVTARLSKPTNKLIWVHFTTRDKTAQHSHDYIPVNGPMFFIPGVNTTFRLFIPIINDLEYEGTEQFEVVLTTANNAAIQDSVGIVSIVDDDCTPIAKLESTSLHILASPNPSANDFTVQFHSSDVKQPVSIRVYEVNGTLLEQREHISIGQILHLGHQYKAGAYIIEAVQGSQRVHTKVIRQVSKAVPNGCVLMQIYQCNKSQQVAPDIEEFYYSLSKSSSYE